MTSTGTTSLQPQFGGKVALVAGASRGIGANATDGPMPAPLADLDPDEFDKAIRTNKGVANLAGYVAGKAGIIGLTKVAALDYADQGIRVNVVAPGPILTYHLEAAGEEAQRLAGLSTPMRRVGQAQEVAATVLWLCSDQASFVTGVTVPIDGGQSAGTKPPRMYRQGQPMEAGKP